MADRPDGGAHPRLEKYLLRKAFDTPADPYLPPDVLWRQKEQFSDGVGYSWVDGLKAHAAAVVSDAAWAMRATRFPQYTPTTREYFLLRELFEAQFPSRWALETVPHGPSIACSTPEALAWDPTWAGAHEISGRAMAAVHEAGPGFDVSPGEGVAAIATPPPSPQHRGVPQRRSCTLSDERPLKCMRPCIEPEADQLALENADCSWESLICQEDKIFALPTQQELNVAMVEA